MTQRKPVLKYVSVLTFALVAAGCASTTSTKSAVNLDVEPRTDLRIFDGHGGGSLAWSDVLDAAADADVVIIGEQHDDAVGHRVERALVEDAAARYEGIALSMEMLDRTEQSVADDYLDDLIDRDLFIQRTASTAWRELARDYFEGKISRKEFREKVMAPGWPDWEGNYQPIIDAAKDGGARIVAANAPWALYSHLVTADGYAKLDTLTPAQRRLIEIADVPDSGGYRERFWEVMVGRAEGAEPESADEDDSESAADDAAAHMQLNDEQVRKAFYAQMMYDATMAGSIADALAAGDLKIVHMVGQFHCDFEGGTVLELRRRAPDARILTISMRPDDADRLLEDDLDRADIVIYTARTDD